MKTILLPTDFKKHSEKAMLFAINIAKKANTKIVVTNCFFVPNVDINMPVDLLEDIYTTQRDLSEKALMQCCQEISMHKNSTGEYIRTEYIIAQDVPSVQISKLIEERKIDLVVMGVENKTHLMDLLGGTALHVSNSSDCPVLLVHEKSEYRYLNRVFFAIENIEDVPKIKKIIPLTRLYDSEISVIHIERRPENEDALETMLYQNNQYNTLLNQIIQEYKHYPNIRFYYNISDETFEKMNHILATQHPDLLVLVHHDRTLIKSVFHKSIIRQILNATDTPLLIIH